MLQSSFSSVETRKSWEVAGIVLVIVAWIAASGQVQLAAQLPYVNLGAGGVIMAGAGDVIYLISARHLLARRIAGVAGRLRPPGEGLHGNREAGR